MRGEKVSAKKKKYKVDRVDDLVLNHNLSYTKACKRMRISRRTYYQYSMQKKSEKIGLEDKRYKGLQDWQIAAIELLIKMEPSVTLDEIVAGIEQMDLVAILMIDDYKPNKVTKYKVWNHLNSRKGLKKDLEMASTLDERESIMIEKYGCTHTSFFKTEDWSILRNILLPKKKR